MVYILFLLWAYGIGLLTQETRTEEALDNEAHDPPSFPPDTAVPVPRASVRISGPASTRHNHAHADSFPHFASALPNSIIPIIRSTQRIAASRAACRSSETKPFVLVVV